MIAYIHILIVLYWIAIRTTKKDSEDKKKEQIPHNIVILFSHGK